MRCQKRCNKYNENGEKGVKTRHSRKERWNRCRRLLVLIVDDLTCVGLRRTYCAFHAHRVPTHRWFVRQSYTLHWWSTFARELWKIKTATNSSSDLRSSCSLDNNQKIVRTWLQSDWRMIGGEKSGYVGPLHFLPVYYFYVGIRGNLFRKFRNSPLNLWRC